MQRALEITINLAARLAPIAPQSTYFCCTSWEEMHNILLKKMTKMILIHMFGEGIKLENTNSECIKISLIKKSKEQLSYLFITTLKT